jgi:hypothetical protein
MWVRTIINKLRYRDIMRGTSSGKVLGNSCLSHFSSIVKKFSREVRQSCKFRYGSGLPVLRARPRTWNYTIAFPAVAEMVAAGYHFGEANGQTRI